jgi:hypothetical protein
MTHRNAVCSFRLLQLVDRAAKRWYTILDVQFKAGVRASTVTVLFGSVKVKVSLKIVAVVTGKVIWSAVLERGQHHLYKLGFTGRNPYTVIYPVLVALKETVGGLYIVGGPYPGIEVVKGDVVEDVILEDVEVESELDVEAEIEESERPVKDGILVAVSCDGNPELVGVTVVGSVGDEFPEGSGEEADESPDDGEADAVSVEELDGSASTCRLLREDVTTVGAAGIFPKQEQALDSCVAGHAEIEAGKSC